MYKAKLARLFEQNFQGFKRLPTKIFGLFKKQPQQKNVAKN